MARLHYPSYPEQTPPPKKKKKSTCFELRISEVVWRIPWAPRVGMIPNAKCVCTVYALQRQACRTVPKPKSWGHHLLCPHGLVPRALLPALCSPFKALECRKQRQAVSCHTLDAPSRVWTVSLPTRMMTRVVVSAALLLMHSALQQHWHAPCTSCQRELARVLKDAEKYAC